MVLHIKSEPKNVSKCLVVEKGKIFFSEPFKIQGALSAPFSDAYEKNVNDFLILSKKKT